MNDRKGVPLPVTCARERERERSLMNLIQIAIGYHLNHPYSYTLLSDATYIIGIRAVIYLAVSESGSR